MFGKSADELAIPILAAIFGLLVLAYLTHWLTHRSDYTLYTENNSWPVPEIIQWAKTNGYEIRAHEMKVHQFTNDYNRRGYGYSGPFTPNMGKRMVYRIVVTKFGEEERRVAWIRLGRGMWGNSLDDFKVIWEDEWRPQEPPVN